MAMLMFEVEENPNCEGMPQLIFNTLAAARQATHVKASRSGAATFHRVTGWSSAGGGTPCPAYAVRVEESGSGEGVLVYGGDWGIRLMPPETSEAWRLATEQQWGEPFLLLNDEYEVRYS
ncbi:MAG: hypothetical protein EXR48_02450 [Dehalococcoidia bacterium]|nr:hypothetical protein [Dehalococcoidia bacterium]